MKEGKEMIENNTKLVDAMNGMSSIIIAIKNSDFHINNLQSSLSHLKKQDGDLMPVYKSIEHYEDDLDPIQIPISAAIQATENKIKERQDYMRVDISNLRTAAQSLISIIDSVIGK